MNCIKKDSKITMNLPKKTSNNKDLPKKKFNINKKKNNKETKIE